MDIKEQVNFINSRTIEGLKVTEVAQELDMGDNALRRILKKNNYIYNRVDKIYLLDKISEAITKEEDRNNETIIKEEFKRNNQGITKEESKKALFSNEEVQRLKELLEVEEQLLHIAATGNNNNKITIMDISNIDRTNRKKSTFNMGIELLSQLEKFKHNSNISKSDIINIALREYLERNKGYSFKQ